MKSKHIDAYGKEIADSNVDSYHYNDTVFHKSTVTASAKTVTY